jgi:deoxyribonuclease V
MMKLMNPPSVSWPGTIAEARRMQNRDRRFVRTAPLTHQPKTVAGVDAAFSRNRVFAAVCVYRYADLAFVEQATAALERSFPYVPGFLVFLEGPAIIAAIAHLAKTPDILLVDGQGIAHPGGIGSASHIGVLLGIPTIGCAKTRLVGEFRDPGWRKGDCSQIRYEGQTVGSVVRTRDRVKPLFVSPGHGVNLDDAVRITLGCTGRYRIPEPLRCADMMSRRMKDDYSA